MRLRDISRLLRAAATVLLAASATAALAQADIAVTLTLNGETTARGAGLTVGGAETYKLEATNNGPSHVTSFVVDATFTPPAAPYNAAIQVTAPADCVPTGTGAEPPPFPCKVTFDPPLVSGAKKSMTIGITVPAPDINPDPDVSTLPTDPLTCPTAGTTVTANASIPAATVLQGTTPVDGNGGNNAASVTTRLRPWTDLSITSITAPPNASEGQDVPYSVEVHNAGPCPATNVFVDFVTPGTVTFRSATGCLNNDAFGPDDDAGCEVGDLAVGASSTFGATFNVNNFPKQVLQASLPVDVEISSTSPDTATPAVDDPDTSNNADGVVTKVDLDNGGGCSTGGAVTVLGGLLSLAALRLGRRRSS